MTETVSLVTDQFTGLRRQHHHLRLTLGQKMNTPSLNVQPKAIFWANLAAPSIVVIGPPSSSSSKV